ncbi:hypothetical protein PM10SUCC1_22330 [Propionigenium maris DSM 9537]|uniref:Uncharacterized protein n=1 Tax=Propionigenium maris DSM 9537 TaxID=1123000 RepID=A0A9W6LNB2_9FUSO|nr:hypothetical protein [Propionigenium maris]GLI56719.1 hypothetical protein PM10SUCC1_22330 [Propionigenium maris DSM 9537]
MGKESKKRAGKEVEAEGFILKEYIMMAISTGIIFVIAHHLI